VLCEHKEEIEKKLFYHNRDLLNLSVDVVLYDLTTLRFESTRTDLGKLRKKYKVRRFIFVADRGLFSQNNLTELRGDNRHGDFIVGMKLGVFQKRHDEFYDISNFHWINEELAVYETTHEGDRCIVTWSKKKAKRDERAREDVLDKIRRKLSKKKIKAKDFVTNKTYQKTMTGLSGESEPALNHEAIEEDAKKDGFFGVITNVKDMTAQTVVGPFRTWRQLTFPVFVLQQATLSPTQLFL
jgi:hypothetical protein